MSVVVDAKLIGHGQKHGIGLANSFVFRELVNKNVRLGGVAAAENSSCIVAEESSDRVGAFFAIPEIGPIAIVHECKDAATDRDARLSRMTCRPPCCHGKFEFARPAGREMGRPLSSFLRVELCRFIASLAARGGRWRSSPRPTRCAHASPPRTARPAAGREDLETSVVGSGRAKPSPRRTSRKTSVWRLAMSASVIPSGGAIAEVAPSIDHLFG